LEFDWSIGELMNAIEEQKLSNDTLFVICSDNGPVLDDGYKDDAVSKLGTHKPSGPFRGGKYSVLEGGTRTPFVTRWKGRIKPAVSDAPVSTIDFAASFASLAKTTAAKGSCRDSVNVLPNLLGDVTTPIRDHILQQDNRGTGFGLRVGPWKLVLAKKKGSGQLYNLDQDPGEAKDLSKSHPEELKRLKARLKEIVGVLP
jgi:arylsulfatase A